jgi:hypothetical protein
MKAPVLLLQAGELPCGIANARAIIIGTASRKSHQRFAVTNCNIFVGRISPPTGFFLMPEAAGLLSIRRKCFASKVSMVMIYYYLNLLYESKIPLK